MRSLLRCGFALALSYGAIGRNARGSEPTTSALKPQRTILAPASTKGFIFEGYFSAKYTSQLLKKKLEDAFGLVIRYMASGLPGIEVGSDFTLYQALLFNQNSQGRL